MTIKIASDHAGFELKEFIISTLSQYDWENVGCFSLDSMDYPDVAHPLARQVSESQNCFGILICGTGNGMAMAANKHENVRAALCWSPEIAKLARTHNNANILVLPARFISQETALEIIQVFFATSFEGGRHEKRVNKINF